MGKHSLDLGKNWIDGLVALGRALGYLPETEFDVAAEDEEPAPVDIAWLRSTDDQFPLFIFEVESTPSGQMAQNAGKVFSQETDLFEKPLFHFHLVLSGSGTSGRVRTAERLFGEFNYRVYTVANAEVAAQAICDILSQHRRVSDRLEIAALARCLDEGIWAEMDLEAVWMHAEAIGFDAPWLRAYADLGLADASRLGRYLRLLERELENPSQDPGQYKTYVGDTSATAIQAAILAMHHPELGERCFAQIRGWQENDGFLKMGAPYYGQNEDYDNFVFALMPAIWGMLAAMLAEVDGTRAWVLEQMELVIGEDKLHHVFVALTAVWMLHIAAGGGTECERSFEAARERLNRGGGIAPDLLATPPELGGRMDQLDAWQERLQKSAEPIPDLESFRSQLDSQKETDLSPVALSYLLSNSEPEDGEAILATLAAQAGGRPA